MNFGDNILKYKEELLSDLKTLMEFKSVYSENPEECKKALAFMLKRAEDFGLVTKNIEDKAGHAQLGEGGRLCGVLTHLDVVPKGNGWSVEPFTLTRKNGRLFGRGAIDDKGASMVDLYCLRALKESGIEGKNTVRVIFGTDEEVGMSDMETYFANEPLPEISFTPDSNYGIGYAEKGILQIKISSEKQGCDNKDSDNKGSDNPDCNNEGCKIQDFDNQSRLTVTAGKAMNAVPDFAQAELNGESFSESGKAAHACEPFKGENALVKLSKRLGDIHPLLAFINSFIKDETDGKSLSIDCKDEPSGELTCCLGTIRINENESYLTLDIRYPVTLDGIELFNKIKILSENNNLSAELYHHSVPLYLPKESETITLLSAAYEDITGVKPDLYSTGGGTYARMLGGKGVGFGPAFKDDTVNMHNADESVDEEKFFTHARICLQAIYRMYTQE